MAGGGGGGEGEPEFQVAPMIDMLLVLLIFFMSITTTQVLRLDRNIEIPIAPDAEKRTNTQNEVIVNIVWDPKSLNGSYSIDGVDYPKADDLTGVIAGRKSTSAEPSRFRVLIRGDRRCHALFVGQAMNAAAQAGVVDIAFSTLSR